MKVSSGVSTAQPPADLDAQQLRARRWLVYTVLGMVVTFLLWAAYFEVDEVVQSHGRFVPAGREQAVQSLEGGILRDMAVAEGEVVERGQVLLRLDVGRSEPAYREARERRDALAAEVARLTAEASGQAVRFPPGLPSALIHREMALLQARHRSLEAALSTLDGSIQALSREIAMTAPLVQQGVVSEVELLRLQRQLSELKGQVEERRQRHVTEARSELARASAELSQVGANAEARGDPLNRAVVYAPTRGIVKSVQATMPGAVVQPGQSIISLIPLDDKLLVEASLAPSDVGFVRVGQPAMVRVGAFDYNRFGGIEGVVESVSPDTLRADRTGREALPEREEGAYRMRISVDAGAFLFEGKPLPLMPGMTATVDVRTGSRTVLTYLTKPLQGFRLALRER